MKLFFLIKILICIFFFKLTPRSAHRPRDKNMPTLEIEQSDKNKKYILRTSHLRAIPLKAFNKKYFFKKILPDKIESRKEKNKFISGKKLNKLANKLIQEIEERKKTYSDFKVLKKTDFNPITKTGLLVAKFKDYPFVIKLFLETAKNYSRPENRSFSERGLFNMGGCIRHLAGFTRVKNAQRCRKKIAQSEKWKDKVILPRKWFWIPEKSGWINIKAYNLGEQPFKVSLPKTYAIIADAIELENKNPTDETCLELSDFFDYNIDPHKVNFLTEKHTGKIALIDTEHFPTMIGATEKVKPAKDYITWYTNITKYYVKNNFFAFKNERKFRTYNTKTYYKL